MRTIILILAIIFITNISYAEQWIVYYDPTKNLTVTDVSGVKDEAKVYEEYKLSPQTQKRTINHPDEAMGTGNGTTFIFYPLQDKAAILATIEAERKQAEIKIKQKLNLTDEELKELKKATQ